MIGRPSPSLVLRSRHICQSCVLRLYPQRRVISQKYLEKQLDAKLAWAKKAAEIQAGKQESMLAMLENRGYVNQIVGFVLKAYK